MRPARAGCAAAPRSPAMANIIAAATRAVLERQPRLGQAAPHVGSSAKHLAPCARRRARAARGTAAGGCGLAARGEWMPPSSVRTAAAHEVGPCTNRPFRRAMPPSRRGVVRRSSEYLRSRGSVLEGSARRRTRSSWWMRSSGAWIDSSSEPGAVCTQREEAVGDGAEGLAQEVRVREPGADARHQQRAGLELARRTSASTSASGVPSGERVPPSGGSSGSSSTSRPPRARGLGVAARPLVPGRTRQSTSARPAPGSRCACARPRSSSASASSPHRRDERASSGCSARARASALARSPSPGASASSIAAAPARGGARARRRASRSSTGPSLSSALSPSVGTEAWPAVPRAMTRTGIVAFSAGANR